MRWIFLLGIVRQIASRDISKVHHNRAMSHDAMTTRKHLFLLIRNFMLSLFYFDFVLGRLISTVR